MVTSDFRPEVEIRLYCACAMKNMHYRQTTYKVTLISSDHNYRKSSVVVALAMGQIAQFHFCFFLYKTFAIFFILRVTTA